MTAANRIVLSSDHSAIQLRQAIAAHVAKSHSGLRKCDTGGNVGHGARSIQPTAAEVSPVTESSGTTVDHIR